MGNPLSMMMGFNNVSGQASGALDNVTDSIPGHKSAEERHKENEEKLKAKEIERANRDKE